MAQDTATSVNRLPDASDANSTDSRIDKVLTEFIGQLFSQHRRTALRGPRGGAMISDPATVETILRAPAQFPKIYYLVEATGPSRFSTNGAEWEHRRDLTQRYYLHAGAMPNRIKVMEVYARRLSGCENTDPSTVRRALLAASTEIFHGAFGCAVCVEPMLEFFDHARVLFKRLQYFSLVPPSESECSALMRGAQALLQLYQDEIQRSPGLTALMENFRSQIGPELGDFIPAAELMMNFFAAIETTSATLSTAIDRLGAFEAAQESLYAELVADEAFPRLECFINEVLRFYPPIPLLMRLVGSDTQLEHLQLKAGSVIAISVIGAHRHPAYWKEPDVFDCNRAEFVQNSYDRRAFIPFSSGLRSCGGTRLARLELVEGLKAFIRRFIVRRNNGDLSFDYAIAMRPKSLDCLEISRRPAAGRVENIV